MTICNHSLDRPPCRACVKAETAMQAPPQGEAVSALRCLHLILYDDCAECAVEARTREIVEWLKSSEAAMTLFTGWVSPAEMGRRFAAAVVEKFLPKEKSAVTSGAEECARRGCTQPNCLGHD